MVESGAVMSITSSQAKCRLKASQLTRSVHHLCHWTIDPLVAPSSEQNAEPTPTENWGPRVVPGPHVPVGPPRHSTRVSRPPDKLMWILPKIWGEELWCTVELNLLYNLHSFVSQLRMRYFSTFNVVFFIQYILLVYHVLAQLWPLHELLNDCVHS